MQQRIKYNSKPLDVVLSLYLGSLLPRYRDILYLYLIMDIEILHPTALKYIYMYAYALICVGMSKTTAE